MGEQARGCGDGDCRDQVDEQIRQLREDFDDKHRQNQNDIRELAKGQNRLQVDLTKLGAKMEPYLDNGQPGLISKISEKLDRLREELAETRGSRNAMRWIRPTLGPLLVGLLLLLAERLWK